jgi:hypothetical protein
MTLFLLAAIGYCYQAFDFPASKRMRPLTVTLLGPVSSKNKSRKGPKVLWVIPLWVREGIDGV